MITFPFEGRCSTFGGPQDLGVSFSEGLALVPDIERDLSRWAGLFLPRSMTGTAGLARSLNPAAFYCAMRWDYAATSKVTLRRCIVLVRGPFGAVWCRPVDYGPARWTKRVIDLSPGAAAVIGVRTDETVGGSLFVP